MATAPWFPIVKVIEGSVGGVDLNRHRTIRRGWWRTRRWARTVAPLSAVRCLCRGVRASFLALALRCGVPFRNPGCILYAYYPELRRVDAARPARGKKFDILFLGGSALHKDWGQVEQSLLEQFAYNGHRNIRIFNLAVPGHTSRDSWLKYSALGAARFDLVLFYQGINDARANNAPPEVFREDYAHYAWYETVNALSSYHRTSWFALPYTLDMLRIRMRQILTKDRYDSGREPRKEWVH
jgi:hypothetical protein